MVTERGLTAQRFQIETSKRHLPTLDHFQGKSSSLFVGQGWHIAYTEHTNNSKNVHQNTSPPLGMVQVHFVHRVRFHLLHHLRSPCQKDLAPMHVETTQSMVLLAHVAHHIHWSKFTLVTALLCRGFPRCDFGRRALGLRGPRGGTVSIGGAGRGQHAGRIRGTC